MSRFAQALDEVLKRPGVMPAAALAEKIKTIHKGRNGTADPSYISHLRHDKTPARFEIVDQIAKAVGEPHATHLYIAFTEDVCPWAAEKIERLAADRLRAELRLTGGDIADSTARPSPLFDRVWAKANTEAERRSIVALLDLLVGAPWAAAVLLETAAAEAAKRGGGPGA